MCKGNGLLISPGVKRTLVAGESGDAVVVRNMMMRYKMKNVMMM